MGDNWVVVVSEHRPKQRKDTPTIQFLDWVHCGAQPDSVMMALVFLNPKGQPVKLMDAHPAASPKELDAQTIATIKQVQAVMNKNAGTHSKMIDFVCQQAKRI